MEIYNMLGQELENCPAAMQLLFDTYLQLVSLADANAQQLKGRIMELTHHRDRFTVRYRRLLWYYFKTDVARFAFLASALQEEPQFDQLVLLFVLHRHLTLNDEAEALHYLIVANAELNASLLGSLILYHIRAPFFADISVPPNNGQIAIQLAQFEQFARVFFSPTLSTVFTDAITKEPISLYSGALGDFRAAFLAHLAWQRARSLAPCLFVLQQIKHSFLRFAVTLELLVKDGQNTLAENAFELAYNGLTAEHSVSDSWFYLLFPLEFGPFDPVREVREMIAGMLRGCVPVSEHMRVLDLWILHIGIEQEFANVM